MVIKKIVYNFQHVHNLQKIRNQIRIWKKKKSSELALDFQKFQDKELLMDWTFPMGSYTSSSYKANDANKNRWKRAKHKV